MMGTCLRQSEVTRSTSKEISMAKAEKKMLGILPKQGVVGVVLGGLIVALVLALVWGYILKQSFDMMTGEPKSSLLFIAELLVLAALIGVVVGILAKAIKPSILWIAGGLGVLAVMWAELVMGAYMSNAAIDTTILKTMNETGISLNDGAGIAVSIGTIVLAAVAAAFVSLGAKIKL
jgi:hypothetical protein